MEVDHDKSFYWRWRKFKRNLRRTRNQMNKKYGDAARFLIEDLAVYAFLFFIFLGSDFIFNFFFIAIGRSDLLKPYSLGFFQMSAMLFCGVQFFRKLGQWKYYA